MNTVDCFQALRKVNPRTAAGFASSVESASAAVRVRIAIDAADAVNAGRSGRLHAVTLRPSRRSVGLPVAGVSLIAAGLVAVLVAIGSPGGGHGVESATAAVKRAVTVSAAAAERSGTAIVRITHGGETWTGTTIRWNGDDIAISRDTPARPRKAGSELLVVDNVVYGTDPRDGAWVAQGDPRNIDPDSGTTPAEYLAAVREDMGGATLRRIIDGMTHATTSELADGSIVYRGNVAAGEIARETGFKDSQAIRVFPFGYVAHDEAADPTQKLQAALTVTAAGVVHEIAIQWGAGGSAWTYKVTYSDLGATEAPEAPANARSLLEEREAGARSQRRVGTSK